MRKLFVILITMLLLVSCGSKSEITIDKQKDYSLPEYYHYEPDEFYEKCDELRSCIENNEKEKAFELYDELNKEALEVYDLDEVCYTKYSENVNDEYFINEQQYIETLCDELSNEFITICHNMTQSSFAKEFEKHVYNDILYSDYINYIEKTQEELDLLARETELKQKYNELNDRIESYTYSYNGKEYLYNEIIDVGDVDYGLYRVLIEGVSRKINKDMGEVYIELVKVRNKIAKLNGYDNYALYADAEIYNRDYSQEDLDVIKSIVKEYGDMYLYYIYSSGSYVENNISGDKLIDQDMEILTSISPYIKDAYEIFDKYHLYSISSGPGRYNGSYETSFSNGSGFIFLNLSNSTRDYFTMTHEFGHFTNAIVVNNPALLTRGGCYDVFEIHSTGLEALFSKKAESLFKDNYKEAMIANLLEQMMCIVDGCIYDEFQRKVYENPNMTLDQINDAFEDTMNEYGWELYGGYPAMRYDWMYIPHNFDSPMYYISYGTSAYATLQIWQQSNIDYEKAVRTWEDILCANPYVDGYVKIISDANLKPFTNEREIREIFENVFEFVEENSVM